MPKPRKSVAIPAGPADALAWKVVDYFTSHPSEVLTPKDVASKFGVAPSAVDPMLASAVASGHLVRAQSDAYGVVYRPPPKRQGFPQPFTPSLREAVKRNRARNQFRLDITAVNIEKDIPLCDTFVRRAPWATIFDRMEVGDSFLLPKAGKMAVAHATSAYRKNGHEGARFSIRQISETHLRVWRIA